MINISPVWLSKLTNETLWKRYVNATDLERRRVYADELNRRMGVER